MTYQVTLTNGAVITNLADNTVDNTTSLTLLGRNYPGYGGYIANNFVRLLENAASTEPPSAPLVGQLWYDTSTDNTQNPNPLMNVWTGHGWYALTSGVSSVFGQTGAITLNTLTSGGLAPLQSPAFFGTPTAPTAAQGTNSNQIATTAYVINQVGAVVGGVSSVIGHTGAVSLSQLTSGGLAPIGSPNFTGTPTAPTPNVGSNNNQVATTAYVINEVGALSTGTSSVCGFSGNVTLAQLIQAGIAAIKQTQFQGICTAPTAATATNTNQIATCAFVLANMPSITTVTGPAGATGATGAPGTPGVNVPVRTLLSGNLTFYVSPVGSDTTGTGTQATPFATMQHAYNILQASYDGGGNTCTIALMNGTHTTGLTMESGLTGFPNGVTIQGVGTSSSAVIVSPSNANCFTATFGVIFTLTGFTLGAPTGSNTNIQQSGNGISCNLGSHCTIGSGLIFGACAAYHMMLQGGYIGCASSYTISGGGVGHIIAAEGGFCTFNGFINGASVTLSGTPAFATFINATTSALIQVAGVSFSGAATGTKYSCTLNGNIVTNGAGINYFPGSTAGVIMTGGNYA